MWECFEARTIIPGAVRGAQWKFFVFKSEISVDVSISQDLKRLDDLEREYERK